MVVVRVGVISEAGVFLLQLRKRVAGSRTQQTRQHTTHIKSMSYIYVCVCVCVCGVYVCAYVCACVCMCMRRCV